MTCLSNHIPICPHPILPTGPPWLEPPSPWPPGGWWQPPQEAPRETSLPVSFLHCLVEIHGKTSLWLRDPISTLPLLQLPLSTAITPASGLCAGSSLSPPPTACLRLISWTSRVCASVPSIQIWSGISSLSPCHLPSPLSHFLKCWSAPDCVYHTAHCLPLG